MLALVTETNDRKMVVYDSDTRLFVLSGERVGNVNVYDSKFGNPCISVKIGETVKHLQELLQKKAGEPVKFYGREESEYFCCFLDTKRNSKNEKCVSAMVDGQAQLVTLEELPKKCGTFQAVLKSKPIKRSEKTGELLWSLSIIELLVRPLPKGVEGYFTDTPNVKFLNQIM